MTLAFDDFLQVDIRVGRILRAEPYPEARVPAFKLFMDFGPELGEKKSSAQITRHYDIEDLPGRLVLAVVNFAPRRTRMARLSCFGQTKTWPRAEGCSDDVIACNPATARTGDRGFGPRVFDKCSRRNDPASAASDG